MGKPLPVWRTATETSSLERRFPLINFPVNGIKMFPSSSSLQPKQVHPMCVNIEKVSTQLCCHLPTNSLAPELQLLLVSYPARYWKLIEAENSSFTFQSHSSASKLHRRRYSATLMGSQPCVYTSLHNGRAPFKGVAKATKNFFFRFLWFSSF